MPFLAWADGLGEPSAARRPHWTWRALWAEVARLVRQASDVVTVRPIGASVEGTPLWSVTVEHPRALRPPVLVVAGLHALEHVGPIAAVRLLQRAAAGQGPWGRRRLVVVPVVNPDGWCAVEAHLAAGRARWRRANARGVDLNRNMPASNWQGTHPAGYYPGPRAGSEPETRALLDLLERERPTRVISIHSPYRTVNYDGPARALAERMAARNGYGTSPDLGYPTPGSFGSYWAIDRGHEVITLELPEIGFHDAWAQNRDALLVALDLLD